MPMVYTEDSAEALDFLRSQRASKEQVDISPASAWWCAVSGGDVVGVVGMTFGKNTDRIKGFFVSDEHRKSGIGAELLHEAVKKTDGKRVTAFCTRKSERLFLSERFEIKRNKNKYGISFLEKRRDNHE